MSINIIGTEYIVEIQNGEQSKGVFCTERLLVRVHDEGGGPFLSIKTDNLEPTNEYDRNTITIEQRDIIEIAKALEMIIGGRNE